MTPEQILNIYVNQGIQAIITLIVLYACYRFLTMRLELYKAEMLDRLKEKSFIVEGDISIMPDDNNTKIFVKLRGMETKKDE